MANLSVACVKQNKSSKPGRAYAVTGNDEARKLVAADSFDLSKKDDANFIRACHFPLESAGNLNSLVTK